MKRFISILFALVLVLSFGLVAAVPVAAQTTYYVATTGDNGNDGSQGSPWLTIQYAINTVTAGDTINVAAGTYNEQVVINTANLTLVSNEFQTTGSTTKNTTLINAGGGAGSKGVHITANGVTVQGFTIHNYENGVYVKNSNATIDNCIIYNTGVTGVNPRGIFPKLEQGSGAFVTITNNEIYDNVRSGTWTNTGGRGISASSDTAGDACGVLIDNNEVYNCDQRGISVAHIPATITNNYIHDIGLPPFDGNKMFVDGILLMYNKGTVLVQDNRIERVAYGNELYSGGIYLYADPQYYDPGYYGSITINRNNINVESSASGININCNNGETYDVFITNNTISGTAAGPQAGIFAFTMGLPDWLGYVDSIEGNTITGNDRGIWLRKVDVGSLHFNNIDGNTSVGLGIDNPEHYEVQPTVNAENNWWGDASGPTHAGNPGGTGDAVSDKVDYDPWANGLRAYSGTPQTGTVGTALANPFVAQLKNSDGTDVAISGITATYAISTYPDGATGQSLSDTSPTTDSNGRASSTLTLGNKVGTYTVTANVPGESTATFTATATGTPNTVTLTANPDELTADGSSTSTLTATVKDQYGNNVADGTDVVFETNHGTLGSSTVTKQTTDGVATATLTSESSTETIIATVTATANGVKDATSVFFIPAGGTGVEESKTEIVTGSGTVDASDTVTGMGDVDIDAAGDHTVTTAKYESNPGGTPTFQSSGNYYDVHLDDDTGVNSLTLNFCPASPGMVIYYWNGTSWIAASNQSYSGGCIVVTVTSSTTPSLSDLSGLAFGSSTAAAEGYSEPPPPAPPAPPPTFFLPQIVSLTITPTEVQIGEAVTITAEVENYGDRSGIYTVRLTIDGVVEGKEEVALAPGEKKTVAFTVIKEKAGTYKVQVGGLLRIEGFIVSGPTPAPAPPAPPSQVKAPVDWWLIIGIIAAVGVIGLIILFTVRRRAY